MAVAAPVMMKPRMRRDVRSFVVLWYQRYQATVRSGGQSVPSCAEYDRVRRV